MKIASINEIFTIFSKNNPNPKTELEYTNNYTLLVAIMLSAQATDLAVNKVTRELFKVINSPYDLLVLGEQRLRDFIKSIGLNNSKAKNIIKASEILITKYHGVVPDSLEILKSLPGVGIKTANVFLNCAFGQAVIGVDTHVLRVSNRLGFVNTKNAENATKLLMEIIPLKWAKHAHNCLVLHGRYICKSKNPNCLNCKIKNYCDFYFSSGRNPPI